MAIRIEKVSPGDLITAEFINKLLEAIELLDKKVEALEGAGKTKPGGITGTVKDPSGAVLGGVAVAVVNELTGETRHVVTDASGRYVVTNLPPGDYRVEVSIPGVQPVRKTGVKVVEAVPTGLDIIAGR